MTEKMVLIFDDMRHMLYRVLPVVEDALQDSAYKKDYILDLIRDIEKLIKEAENE